MGLKEEVLRRWGATAPRPQPSPDVSERSRQLLDYAQLLKTVAKTLGLVGFSPADVWVHIARALLVGDAVASEGASSETLMFDVGSGAGLPGLPIAIANPWKVALVEPKLRAVSFLEKAVRELGLSCEIVPARAEDAAAAGRRESADAVTARSLAPPQEAARICAPLLKAGGVLILTAAPEDHAVPDLAAFGLAPPVTTILSGPLDITQRVHIIRKTPSSN